ncbi:MAG: hypothetical protein IPI30_14555 [Saprospiraceae bacterium]|nr:hypothetical protein [Candidatus Vicinibacter affinis]
MRISGFYANLQGEIIEIVDQPLTKYNKHVWPTREQAEGAMALAEWLRYFQLEFPGLETEEILKSEKWPEFSKKHLDLFIKSLPLFI